MTVSPVAVRGLALFGGYAAASLIAYGARNELLAALLPAIGWVVDTLLPDGMARAALGTAVIEGQELVALDVALTRPLQVGATLVPAGEALHATTLAAYAVQHAALIYAVLAAWPTGSARARAGLLLLGLPAVTGAALLDIPFVLAGLVHDLLLEAGATETASRGLALYYEFLHRGGRAGISIAVAVAVCLPFGTSRGVKRVSRQNASSDAHLERSAAPSGKIAGHVGAAQQPPAFD